MGSDRRPRWAPPGLTGGLAAGLALALVAGSACKDSDGEREDLQAAAGAMLGSDKQGELSEQEAEARAERQRRFQARKQSEAERDAALAAIAAEVVRVPEPPPKDLATACDALVDSYADWMRAIYFDDDRAQLEFFDSKKKNLGEVRGSCAKLSHPATAGCMVAVIEAVSAEDYPEDKRKLIQAQPDALFKACAAKTGD